MASPYKTSKADLVAIYRLEFYKKQKSWKYCSQERKKEEEKRRAARRAKLNKTYDIGPAPEPETDTDRQTDVVDKEAEELKDLNLAGIEVKREESKEIDTEESPSTSSPGKADELNEAFVDTETEDTAILPTQLDSSIYPYSPKWSIKHWSAQRRKHLEKEDPSTPTQNTSTYPLQNAHIYPAQDAPNDPCQDTPAYPSQNTFNYPFQDTQGYTTQTNNYSPNFQVNPIQDSPNYFHGNQMFPNQDYQQIPQLYPACETSSSKQLIQVFPSARSRAYPTDPNHPNPYDPDFPYMADVPALSPALPQSGAILDTGEHRYGAYEGLAAWPAQSQVWTRHEWNEGAEDIAAPAGGLAAGDAVDGPELLLGRAQRWLSGSHLSSAARCDSALSVSSESFSRGAALAPHSTEIDLRISDSCEEMAPGLSTAALSAAVARHADALSTLLGEARKRDLTSPSLDKMHSFEEYPTRDACPAAPSDAIVAGPFRNTPDLAGYTERGASRGRGKRVYEAPVIGIGRGRPYRI